MTLLQTLLGIVRHPLNTARPIAALGRFAAWQIGTRLVGGAVAVPFVDSTRLLVRRGMTGATGNVYCGLHEFEDMAFVLHALRPHDLFVDVGANIGAYTILAAGAARAGCVCIEPVPATFATLVDNLRLNNLATSVDARNVAAGASAGTIKFTSALDTVNHALSDGETSAAVINVPVAPLDDLLAGRSPTLIKIDVEGFETEVIGGAARTLRSPSLLGVLMELNGSGTRYGFDENALHERMLAFDFQPASYEPFARILTESPTRKKPDGNILYIRRLEELRARLKGAPKFKVLTSML